MLDSDLAAKRKRKRSDYGYHLEYRTRWSDNDVYGHMNNSIYAFLIDSIVNAYLIEHCGLDPTASNPTAAPQIGLVVSSYCDYFSSLRYPTVAELGLRVAKLGKSSVLYEVGIFEKGHEAVRAVGGSIHVFVEREGRRPAKEGMEEKIKEGLDRILTREKAKL